MDSKNINFSKDNNIEISKKFYDSLPINKRADYILKLFKLGKTIYDLYKLGIPRTSLERVNKKFGITPSRFDKTEMKLNNEIFKSVNINGYNRYLVSDTGKVFSLRNNTMFKPFIDKDGYEKIGLRSTIDNKRHSFGVHELVINTFGIKPLNYNDLTVDHINGIKTDNRIENLRWLEHSINSSALNKHYKQNIQVSNRSVSDNDVKNICYLIDKGYSINDISKQLNIKTNVVKSIKVGQTFRYISENYNFVKNKKISNKIPIEDFYNMYFSLNNTIKDIKSKYDCHEKVIKSLKDNLYDWDNSTEYIIKLTEE